MGNTHAKKHPFLGHAVGNCVQIYDPTALGHLVFKDRFYVFLSPLNSLV